MSKKNKPDSRGFVYSTDPGFSFQQEKNAAGTIPPAKQPLKIWLDSRHRAGKVVTLITGFIGLEEDLQELGRKLKSFCGTGGSAKEGEIIVQGDHREKVLQWLLKNGYTSAKKM
ncbi:MAG: translation initiation factor [Chitinophagaceae bacterium]